MSAPASNTDLAIRLRPEIVIDPSYRVVQPDVARNQAAPTDLRSPEQRERDIFNLGQRFPNGDHAMANDAHGKKDDHGPKSSPEWATKWMAWAVVLIVLFLAGGYFFDRFNGNTGAGSQRAVELQTQLNDMKDEVRRLKSGDGVVTGGGGRVGNGRPPSADEAYQRQLQRGNVTSTRVPCADGFDLLPNGNCGRWVPN